MTRRNWPLIAVLLAVALALAAPALLEAAKALLGAHLAGVPLDKGDHRWTVLTAAIAAVEEETP